MTMRKWIHICLAILFPIHLCSCATPAAIKYAEEQASKPTIYKKIANIYPIAFREDQNVELCVTLSCQAGDCGEENYQVIIPVDLLHSGKKSPKKMDLLADPVSNDPNLPVYWFPLKKPSATCEEITANKVPAGDAFYLEKLRLHTDKWKYLIDAPRSEAEIYAIFASHNKDMFSSGEVQILQTVKPDDLTVSDVYLIYLPDKENGSTANAMCLIGGYNDPSTKAGYVLIPFALVADAALVAAAAMLVAVVALAAVLGGMQ